MNITCSSAGIVYADYPRQGVADVANAGFENVLLDCAMYCPPNEFEKYNRRYISYKIGERVLQNPDSMQNEMESMMQECQKKSLKFRVALAPFLHANSEREDLLPLLEQAIAQSIKIAGTAGCKYLIVHPIYFDREGDALYQQNKSFLLKFAESARANGLQILIQNQIKNHNGHLIRGFCSDAVEAANWVDELNAEASSRYGEGEYFGISLHTGCCNVCGQNMYDFTCTLGQRIKVVILTENDGHQMASLLPFSVARGATSQLDWLNLIRGLRKIRFDGELLMEFCDTVLSYSTLLRPQVMNLAKATAEFLKWQVELELLLDKYPARVLFGAGNMCRNYMKCYGEQYPPLYTCDNNPSKWGTEFCGLEIKAPEELKKLSDDTAIFICNVYYREIEGQLRDMGISNPIVFFNDEYMPSFHFDRVEDILMKKENGEA